MQSLWNHSRNILHKTFCRNLVRVRKTPHNPWSQLTSSITTIITINKPIITIITCLSPVNFASCQDFLLRKSLLLLLTYDLQKHGISKIKLKHWVLSGSGTLRLSYNSWHLHWCQSAQCQCYGYATMTQQTEGYHLVIYKVATEYHPIGPDCLLLKQQQIVHISWPLQWYHRQSHRVMYGGRVC